MDRILYSLICVCVSAAVAGAFVAKVDITKITMTEVAITVAFLGFLAACSFALHVSPWGQSIKNWFNVANDRVRIEARDKGTVRKPPWWSYWP